MKYIDSLIGEFDPFSTLYTLHSTFYQSHTLTVSFEDTQTDLKMIADALNDVGYTVGEPEEIRK